MTHGMNSETLMRGGGGTEIWTGEWGNPDGPPILLIHGFMQSHLSWSAQLDSDLANDFRLIAIATRGHGRSGKPEDPAAYQDGQNWADDIAAVMDQLVETGGDSKLMGRVEKARLNLMRMWADT